MGRWWMSCWTAALPCTRSIPSSSTACATVSALPGPRTTGARPGLQRLGCARIGLCSAACWPVTQAWLSSASGRGWPKSCSKSACAWATGLGHRVRQQLWRYYPQLLALSDNGTAEWVLALWTRAPTPAQAARLREAMLARLLRQHRIRKLAAPAVRGILRQPAITVAPGVTEAAVLPLRSLVARLRLANQEFHQAARKLEELCTALNETQPSTQDSGPSDGAILHSLPGVGPVTLATLLTEAAGPISRRDYTALRTLSGVAPVTKRSGKSCLVIMRYAAQLRLRNAVFHWARVAVLNDPKCRRRYAALRARGHSYGRALRGVADRLLGVACVLLQRQVLFDPNHGAPTAP